MKADGSPAWHLNEQDRAYPGLGDRRRLVLIVATHLRFLRINRTAGALLVPCLCRVCFTSALTYVVWQNNPTPLQ